MKPSRGTVVASNIREIVKRRDNGCVGPRVGMDGECFGALELDHVRASHGIGMKSSSLPDNLITLCSVHHRLKTDHGKTWRPVLIDYLGNVA